MTSTDLPEKGSTDQNTYKWKALFTVALGTIMSTMDMSITNISFPELSGVFKAELSTVMWVALAYTLVSTSLLLVLGKISDLIGRKKIYTGGICVFTLGLIACSLSQSVGQLIFFRMLQAVGGGMIMSCGTAVIIDAFPPQERGMGMGLQGVFVSIGFITGPVLGGFLLNWLDWRSIFYVRVPIGLIAFFLAAAFLKSDQARIGKIKLDLKGTVTSSAGLACLILGVSQINKFGLGSPFIYLLIGLGLISLTGFIIIERRVEDPVVDLTFFKKPTFSLAVCSLFFITMTYPSFSMILPFYLMRCIDLTSSTAGLLMTVTSLTNIVVGPVSGWLSDRFGSILFATLGAVTSTAALYFALGFNLDTSFSSVIPVMVLLGFGIGAFQPPNNSTIMGGVPQNRLGTAAALIAVFRHMGIMLGMALTGTIFTVRKTLHQTELIDRGLETGWVTKQSLALSFHDVLFIAIFFGSLAAVLSLAPILLEKDRD